MHKLFPSCARYYTHVSFRQVLVTRTVAYLAVNTSQPVMANSPFREDESRFSRRYVIFFPLRKIGASPSAYKWRIDCTNKHYQFDQSEESVRTIPCDLMSLRHFIISLRQ